MFTKILVAVDGSDNSLRAAQTARDIAACMQSQITILYAAYIPPLYSVDIHPEVRDALHEDGRKILDAAAKVFKGTAIEPTERLVFDERPDEAILRLIEEDGFDLVILGSRGLHGKELEALGSTSLRVLDKATCPVLVVH
ncbi:universal stress protein [bacterium]|nr:universal stress protein [bacterium]